MDNKLVALRYQDNCALYTGDIPLGPFSLSIEKIKLLAHQSVKKLTKIERVYPLSDIKSLFFNSPGYWEGTTFRYNPFDDIPLTINKQLLSSFVDIFSISKKGATIKISIV